MKKYYCDICGNEFNPTNGRLSNNQLILTTPGGSSKTFEVCSKCLKHKDNIYIGIDKLRCIVDDIIAEENRERGG